MPAVVQTFRDPELSLWQAAVDATYRDDAGAPPPPAPVTAFAARAGLGGVLDRMAHPFLRAADQVAVVVQTMQQLGHDVIGSLLPKKPVLTDADLPPAEGVTQNFTQFGLLVIALARQAGNDPDAFRELLKTKYSDLDPGWIEVAVNYFLYVQLKRQGIPGYKTYNSLNDYIIEGKLPDKGRVALLADWGTGTPEAVALLRLVAAKKPDVVIHLGDVYYAGTEKEFATFRQEYQDILKYQDGGPVVLTLSGNHDMYSGGKAYYETLTDFGQPSSYFCLRNTNWQFLAMDTGYRNSALALGSPPGTPVDPHGLDPKEADWVNDKVANAGGRNTILLSHHQPFSAFEKLTGGGPVNVELLNQIKPTFGGVSRWYFGHEHDLIVYLDSEKYQGVLGRCIGHAAIPMPVATYRLPQVSPQGTDDFSVPTWNEEVELDPMSDNPNFYNHGYVIIDLDGKSATATHYQTSDPEKVLFTEDLRG
jgi:Calcineurin-like phosphoesterase